MNNEIKIKRRVKAYATGTDSAVLLIPAELRIIARALEIPVEDKRYHVIFNRETEEIIYRPIELNETEDVKSD